MGGGWFLRRLAIFVLHFSELLNWTTVKNLRFYSEMTRK